MSTKKIASAAGAVIALVLGIAAAFVLPANATGGYEPCVPSDAWTETIDHPAVTETYTETIVVKEAWTETKVIKEAHWQRYSWTGGKGYGADSPPPFPHEKWQPNVKGDPHGVGQEGAYWRSAGKKGKGDWFYLEWVEAVTKTIEHPAVTKEVTKTRVVKEAWTETIEHPAVECPEPEPTPTDEPTSKPTEEPTPEPTDTPTPDPTDEPEEPGTDEPEDTPTDEPDTGTPDDPDTSEPDERGQDEPKTDKPRRVHTETDGYDVPAGELG